MPYLHYLHLHVLSYYKIRRRQANMQGKYVIAYDLGTGGLKASLHDASGTTLAFLVCEYPTLYYKEVFHEQRPEDWWQAICRSTRLLLDKVKEQNICKEQICALAISGHSLVGIPMDREGRPLVGQVPIWSDGRAKEQARRFFETHDYNAWYETTGNGDPPACYTLFKIMWMRENQPEIYEKTAYILGSKDYINFRLCGTLATDPSDASGTNAYDLNRWQWSEEIIEAAGLDLSLFPEVRSSIDVIGEVTNEAARETGLLAGTPVICGGGDGSCAGVGVGCVAPGSAYNYLGSSSWVALTVEKPIVDEQRRTMNWAHVVPGMLHPSGTMQTAGASYNWMVQQLCLFEQEEARIRKGNVYELIDEQILSSPIGANKLLFLPYMLGERTPRWNVDAKGAFIGLTLGHTHGDMLRAVMEGITLNLGFIVNIFRKHVPIDQVTVIGGCAQNPVWRQMMADIYQAEIRVPNYLEEATSMGAAILAGIGAGVFKDFSVIDRFVRIEQTVQPIQENVKKYEAWMPVFDKAYHALCDMYTEIAKTELDSI